MADLQLSDFHPIPRLVVKETRIEKPRFPVIDGHNHLGEFGGHWDQRPLAELLDVLDAADVRTYIDLDGGWGEDILNFHLDKYKQPAPDRFVLYGGVDWAQWPEQGDNFGEWAAQRFRAQVARGAQGLKVWKPFGLTVRDQNGALVSVDDTRLDPLWQTVGELNLPVTIHVADPVAFFEPLDNSNERWDELGNHPEWHFPSPPYPPFMTIMTALANLIARHRQTTFVVAHVGCYAENLGWVSALLDRCPNFYVDISARVAELGRQPYSARRFFLTYPDRILFGTDQAPDVEMYRRYYRFLESDDEYFPYSSRVVPPQGRWNIYGLFLPDGVLKQVYYDNARRVILRQP